jgi:hypothetical protein
VFYDEVSASKALQLASDLQANLGGTEIRSVLSNIYQTPMKGQGIRQVFLITDGEVSDTDVIIHEASDHRRSHRCFCIGVGIGADAGLVEGIANATGGRSDFVSDERDLSDKVIGQLSMSMQGCINKLALHIGGDEAFEVVPFPISPVSFNVSSTIFVKSKAIEEDSILISGNYFGSSYDILSERRKDNAVGECFYGLFAYESLRVMSRRLRGTSGDRFQALKSLAVSLSISSGVLCEYTSFVGVSEKVYRERGGRCCPGSKPVSRPISAARCSQLMGGGFRYGGVLTSGGRPVCGPDFGALLSDILRAREGGDGGGG